MSANQELLYNVTGQTFFFDCPRAHGRPSSVTSATVYANTDGDDGTAETATTGSASVETNPNTTFDASSGDGQTNPKTCNLTATTGTAIGRRYLATNATSETEWVEVAEISSGVSVTSKYPLENAYESADTFESTRIQISVLDAWIQDKDNISADLGGFPKWRVRWVYVDKDSVTRVADSYVDVVRYRAQHSVTALDIESLVANYIYNLPTDQRADQGQGLIDMAYRQVGIDMRTEDKSDEMARDRELVDDLVMHKAVYLYQFSRLQNGGGDPDATEAARIAYETRFDKLVRRSARIPFSIEGGGGATTVERRNLTRR